MIRVEAVVKRYGGAAVAALDGVDLHVPAGRVCALLGANGAGKTTLVSILATLRRPDSGQVAVAGYDVVRDAAQVRRHVGLVGQHAAVDEVLTGRQNLVLFARLTGRTRAAGTRRAAELIDAVDLADAADRAVGGYSGGMRRRLDLAIGLVDHPAVLLVDEPTTGLDPRGRRELWDQLRARVAEGTTVVLTTQYLVEADALADDVVILRDGQVVAAGTPGELKATVGGTLVELALDPRSDERTALAVAGRLASGRVDRSPDGARIRIPLGSPGEIAPLCAALEHEGIAVDDLTVRRPTLDDVFLTLHEEITA